ncbi:MAG: GWxTD domain-containing protein, partial [Candidatus Aminicenantales bacterium]
KMSPESKEFLSTVRYIITPEEKKIFREIPEEERPGFIQEFWDRRDPDPDTEENELKDLYFSRIEEANRLFSSGRPGWLTDRGEIYILLGPPTNVDRYPMGQGPGTRPTEIWYYGNFPIVFVDEYGTGDYRRFEQDVIHIHEVNKALRMARMTLQYEPEFFDFSMKFQTENGRQSIVVEIPYTNIWLKETPEGGETDLVLSLEVYDQESALVWNFNQRFHLAFTTQELEEMGEKGYVIRIPVAFAAGRYTLNASLLNETGEKESRKRFTFRVR